MYKSLLLVVFMITLMGCNTTQTVVRTTKPTYKKPAPRVVTTTRKPAQTKPTASRSTASKPVTKSAPAKSTATKTVPVKTNPVAVAPKKIETPVKESNTSVEIQKIEEKYELAKEENKSNANESVYSKTEILEATTRVKVTTAMVLDYIDTYKEIAKSNMREFGIPSSIILGQGILESGSGTGTLSVLANNHFGIKCHKDWNGPSVKYDDDEEKECFRKYEQPGESYKDHSLFLTGRAWYQPLFKLPKDDYKQWARGLKVAGYATDPKYPDKLIGIIERYQLNRFDSEVLGTEYIPINTKDQISMNSDIYQVSQGDTLYSISKRFNITIDDLKRINNINDNSISIGQNLKIK